MRQQVIKKLSWDYLLARFMKIVGNNLIVILISFKKKIHYFYLMVFYKKIAAIMQPYFFPYIGYFQLINEASVFVLYDKVTYRKSSWLNRNRIKQKGNSSPVYITVPVKNPSANNLIEETEISKNIDWRNNLKKLIYYNYKRASFFNEVYPDIVELIFYEEQSLHLFNSNILTTLCNKLSITTPIITQNEQHSKIESRLDKVGISKEDVRQQRVVELCNLYNASSYINPINGMDLYCFDFFNKHKKDLRFIKTDFIEYPQFKGPFLENLSIIDVLMHNGYEGTKDLLQKRKLIS
ncbi:MAG: WbqC family protein [Flavobacteriaceae bacterium]